MSLDPEKTRLVTIAVSEDFLSTLERILALNPDNTMVISVKGLDRRNIFKEPKEPSSQLLTLDEILYEFHLQNETRKNNQNRKITLLKHCEWFIGNLGQPATADLSTIELRSYCLRTDIEKLFKAHETLEAFSQALGYAPKQMNETKYTQYRQAILNTRNRRRAVGQKPNTETSE